MSQIWNESVNDKIANVRQSCAIFNFEETFVSKFCAPLICKPHRVSVIASEKYCMSTTSLTLKSFFALRLAECIFVEGTFWVVPEELIKIVPFLCCIIKWDDNWSSFVDRFPRLLFGNFFRAQSVLWSVFKTNSNCISTCSMPRLFIINPFLLEKIFHDFFKLRSVLYL